MTTKKRVSGRPKKRAYRTPKLRIHGDLKAITMGKGGALGDGVGQPKTRVASGPG